VTNIDVWYAGILGHKMNGFPVIAAVPLSGFDDAVVIMVEMPDKFVTSKLYSHHFKYGQMPREWDTGNYFHYNTPAEYGSARRTAMADLMKRALSLD
jgi:hypothetical protein